ncbi:MAG: hypothetical protein ACTHLY_17230 [Pseudolabrys sp.]
MNMDRRGARSQALAGAFSAWVLLRANPRTLELSIALISSALWQPSCGLMTGCGVDIVRTMLRRRDDALSIKLRRHATSRAHRHAHVDRACRTHMSNGLLTKDVEVRACRWQFIIFAPHNAVDRICRCANKQTLLDSPAASYEDCIEFLAKLQRRRMRIAAR